MVGDGVGPVVGEVVGGARDELDRQVVRVRLVAADLALMACAEGVILHRNARHDETDPRPLFALVVAAALP